MSTEQSKIASMLRSHPATIGLDDAAVHQIAAATSIRELKQGEMLFSINDQVEAFYLVTSGRLSANALMPDGSKKRYDYVRSGDQVGVLAMAGETPMPVEVVADEFSALLKFTKAAARSVAEKYPLFERNLIRKTSAYVGEAALSGNKKRKIRLVGVIRSSCSSNDILRSLVHRLGEVGESLAIASDDAQFADSTGLPKINLVDETGAAISADEIRHQIGKLLHVDRILISLDGHRNRDAITSVLGYADETFWIVDADNHVDAASTINALVSDTPAWRDQINIVWSLPEESVVAPRSDELSRVSNRGFHVRLASDADAASASLPRNVGIERMVHYLRGVQIGVALGGGAALGMGHLGVLKALDQAGIVFDMMAGTSAGAMTGTIYASGRTPAWAISHFADDLRLPWYFRMLPLGGYLYLLAKFRFRQWESMLRKYLGSLRLEQFGIPISTIAVDLVSGEQVIRRQGDAVDAILESINLPILSVPINKAGKAIVDGGYLNNVPANVLFQQGCTFVVAINVVSEINAKFAGMTPDTPQNEMRSASILQTLARLRAVQDRFIAGIGSNTADFKIEPNLAAFNLSEFERADEIAALGKQETEEQLPQLKEHLAKVDASLFSDLQPASSIH